jgi:hypothetical protein
MKLISLLTVARVISEPAVLTFIGTLVGIAGFDAAFTAAVALGMVSSFFEVLAPEK